MSELSAADTGNHMIATQVIEHAALIEKLAAQIDADLGLYLEPESAAWSDRESTPSDMVAAWLAIKNAHAELRLVVARAEELACDALGPDTVITDGFAYRVRSVPKRTYPPERKSELRDVMLRTVARKVAVSPLTGELDDDRARVAHEAIRELDRWQTIDPAKFKLTTLKAEGVDVGEFSETQWSKKVEESPA